MSKVLVSWIGHTDLKASTDSTESGLGTVAQAVADCSYDGVVLLSNYPEQKGSQYRSWLKGRAQTQISLHHVTLTGPTLPCSANLFGALNGYVIRNKVTKGEELIPPESPSFTQKIKRLFGYR